MDRLRQYLLLVVLVLAATACGPGGGSGDETPAPGASTGAAATPTNASATPTPTATVSASPTETVTVTASPSPTTSAAAGEILYQDDFEDPASGRWNSDDTAEFSYGYTDGLFRFEVKKADEFIRTWPVDEVAPRYLFDDTRLEADVTLEADGGEGAFSMYCWRRSSTDRYELRLTTDGAFTMLRHYYSFATEQSEAVRLAGNAGSVTAKVLAPGTTRRVALECLDTDGDEDDGNAEFRLLIDDQEVQSWDNDANTDDSSSDERWTVGRAAVGVESTSGTVAFTMDNFVLRATAPEALVGEATCEDPPGDADVNDDFPDYQPHPAFEILGATVEGRGETLSLSMQLGADLPTRNDSENDTWSWQFSLRSSEQRDMSMYIEAFLEPGSSTWRGTVVEYDTELEFEFEPDVQGDTIEIVIDRASLPTETPFTWDAYTRANRPPPDPEDFDITLVGDNCADQGAIDFPG